MKRLITILLCLICIQGFSKIKLPDYWLAESIQKDSTLATNKSKLTLTIYNSDTGEPHIGASIHLNVETFLGLTDSNGMSTSEFNTGIQRICIDTRQGNSFIEKYTFEPQKHYKIKVWMSTYKSIAIDPNSEMYPVADKPVIYLYPKEKQKVNLQVKPEGGFTFTYPTYTKSGWEVTADPNGNIMCHGRSYNYLFWEGPLINKSELDLTTGFYVHSDTVVQFLENTLTKVGLTDTEQADFITYWVPRLIKSDLNFIHFEFNEGYEQLISKMKITPTPKSLIRVFMVFKPVKMKTIIQNQNIPTYKREGFTVVEWGGSKI